MVPPPDTYPRADIVVIGAGAAGLMAGIVAARTTPSLRVMIVDGAARLGAKILISGGGRCNVTHDVVNADAFAGSSRNTIRKVLRRFDVAATVAFFDDLGVALRREATGKLFPVANRARVVLDALLTAAEHAGVHLEHPFRVETVTPTETGLRVNGPAGTIETRRVILATGGQSVVQTGSDGHGYVIARSLGHTITPHLLQALVPLLLPAGHPLCALRGVSADVRLRVVSARGASEEIEGSLLLTHFGVSGPAAMDISRYLLAERLRDAEATLRVSWLPDETQATVDAWLRPLAGSTPGERLAERLPRRLADALCAVAGVDPEHPGDHLTKQDRAALVRALTDMELPITEPRGWPYAEVTAGGIPLTEVDVKTMASRVCDGVYVCGEICDVDGRIGGFNFQWAWSSGYVAGVSAAV